MTKTTDAVASAWRESVRGFVGTACEALERAEWALYLQTDDEQVERFTRRFERAVEPLFRLAVDELDVPCACDVDAARHTPPSRAEGNAQ